MKVKVYMELEVEDTSPIFSSTPNYHMEDIADEVCDLVYENDDFLVIEISVEKDT